MNNMSNIIKGIIKKSSQNHMTEESNAIAGKEAECAMEGNCQVNNVVYKSDVTRPLPRNLYLGLAEEEWKSRFYNH